ncbi:MAG: hypothetical protein ABS95_00875 [Verrucomicrobia bacterium SCN 57-15]|nr:MAG: hypothetical protein ABS95_00875 [Verrucomicrobia bacterium SCN 57-15]
MTEQIMKPNNLKLSATIVCLLAFAPAAFPHAGHGKAPGEDGETSAFGPIAITAEAKKNLAIKVEEADVRTIEKTFMAIGQIEPIPNRSAAVSSRISGRVAELKVNPGETVRKGQVLVEVESRQLGDPPPRAQYTAPIDGVVTDRHVLLGDTVEPDKHLMEIVDLSEVYAEGRIFEGQVASVKLGQKVRLHVEAYPEVDFEGTVDLMSGQLEPESRTLNIWVRVKNKEARLRPNMRATLYIVTDVAESVVAAPLSAVLGGAGRLFVFVQSDEEGLIYDKRAVVTGMKDDRYVEIIEGVFPSDKLVTEGNYQLQYVTTKPKSPESTNSVAAAVAGPQPAPTGGMRGKPWFWMGITLGVLLLANVIVMLLRKRAGTPAPVEPTPANAVARGVVSAEASSK